MIKKDNIVAIASANGYAGVGIVRISGYNLDSIIKQISKKDCLKPRIATYSNIYAYDGSIIDSAILLYFPSPNSFTGEDVLEIQTHGSPVVLQMILKLCIKLDCKMAKPGEFSQRAYENGKMDLVQAESIIDLIHAESEIAVKSAVRSLQGKFSEKINQIKNDMINLRMFVEASIDFPEEDIEFIIEAKIHDKLILLKHQMETLLKNTQQGVLINNGINLVIIGRPNVGKSTLLNTLANEDIAIVSDIAGTTRDIIKQKIIINGLLFNIIDTAGIRDTDDIIEKIGIDRTKKAIDNANLCLIIVDESIGIVAEDENIIDQLPANIIKLYVHNKIDLIKDKSLVSDENIDNVYISAKHGIGVDTLRKLILNKVGYNNDIAQDVYTARTRHINYINKTLEHVDLCFVNWHNLEVLAEELRYAHNSLSEIIGEFTSDQLLGEIFSKFCIGK
jgi:tRNA modification GTPase